MKKEIKKLSKNEQKAIVGGACEGGAKMIYCGTLKMVCPDFC